MSAYLSHELGESALNLRLEDTVAGPLPDFEDVVNRRPLVGPRGGTFMGGQRGAEREIKRLIRDLG